MNVLFGHVPEPTIAGIAAEPSVAERLPARYERHLAGCDRCSRLLQGHRRASSLLRSGWQMVPADGVAGTSALAGQPGIRLGPAFGRRATSRPGAAWLALALLAAMVLAIVGSVVFTGGGPPPQRLPGRLAIMVQGEIVTVELDGADPVSVTAATGGSRRDASPAWSPDGTHLAFARIADDNGNDAIAVVGYPALDEVRIIGTLAGPSSGLFWSPAGTSIAAWSNSGIELFGVDGSGSRPLRRGMHDAYSHLTWSPDGSQILASTYSGDLVTVRTTDGTVTTIAPPDRPFAPGGRFNRASRDAWSPDGGSVVYLADLVDPDEIDFADGRIEVVDADGSNRRVLHDGQTPTWSPDGLRIAFDWEGPPGGIYTIRPDGTDIRFVDAGRRPSWSPDGRFIAYCGGTGGNGIFVAPASGGEPRLLHEMACWYDNNSYVSWQPVRGT